MHIIIQRNEELYIFGTEENEKENLEKTMNTYLL